ncbi:ArsR/SmtB family transcription factor [Promicromonospora iranensis]|uniref:DNA-binding transcriptional ArsR family regulator n=1 Tax=Promicromonospora iranensis TaxID=1105144 RepID=A0ABU2CSZ3_9MICO|nr:metalloregulator ArsR/SmtB family transcription factor [Promicromonospora iranensis]MDR7384449.1 DNA-binding transcriptional ArsR family regulator [Promicromonospora iranensis]
MSRNTEEPGDGLFSALAHRARREILRYLRDKDYVRAGDIGAALGIGPSTLSGHLKVLRQAGLVETRRRATEVQYRLQMSLLDEAIVALAELRRPRSSAAAAGAISETDESGDTAVHRTVNQEGTP